MNIKCKNSSCKFYKPGKEECENCSGLNEYGACDSYEHGFLHYVRLVWNELEHTNFIHPLKLDKDLKLGLYFVMKLFNLELKVVRHGGWEVYGLVNEDDKMLSYEEIIELEINESAMTEIYNAFNLKGITPEIKELKSENIVSKEFGFLTPTGTFIEAEFGDHEKKAKEILEEKHFEEEYSEYRKEDYISACDFLSKIKGYAIIHDPLNSGRYAVSHLKPLTKVQKEFLYGYFTDLGDYKKAESFLDND